MPRRRAIPEFAWQRTVDQTRSINQDWCILQATDSGEASQKTLKCEQKLHIQCKMLEIRGRVSRFSPEDLALQTHHRKEERKEDNDDISPAKRGVGQRFILIVKYEDHIDGNAFKDADVHYANPLVNTGLNIWLYSSSSGVKAFGT